ncbi:MAG TPA: hypothetical protein PKB15_07045 [Acidimicrobiia bacterium]|nr:hypothetical protein [Acidimicrobiia bacterium]
MFVTAGSETTKEAFDTALKAGIIGKQLSGDVLETFMLNVSRWYPSALSGYVLEGVFDHGAVHHINVGRFLNQLVDAVAEFDFFAEGPDHATELALTKGALEYLPSNELTVIIFKVSKSKTADLSLRSYVFTPVIVEKLKPLEIQDLLCSLSRCENRGSFIAIRQAFHNGAVPKFSQGTLALDTVLRNATFSSHNQGFFAAEEAFHNRAVDLFSQSELNTLLCDFVNSKNFNAYKMVGVVLSYGGVEKLTADQLNVILFTLADIGGESAYETIGHAFSHGAVAKLSREHLDQLVTMLMKARHPEALKALEAAFSHGAVEKISDGVMDVLPVTLSAAGLPQADSALREALRNGGAERMGRDNVPSGASAHHQGTIGGFPDLGRGSNL